MGVFGEWYDVVDLFQGENDIFHHPKTDYNPSRWLLRLKPEFRDRMIKAGYSGDPTGRNNQTMGMLYDLNRAFLGLESPLNKEFNKLKKDVKA